MSGFNDEYAQRMILWYQRVARYRALSRLFGDKDGSGPLAAMARAIEEQIQNLNELSAGVHDHRLRTRVLVAEVDTVLARARAASMMDKASAAKRGFSTEDLRDESRLCVEEADAALEIAERRALSARGVSLAQVADVIEYRNGGARDGEDGRERGDGQVQPAIGQAESLQPAHTVTKHKYETPMSSNFLDSSGKTAR